MDITFEGHLNKREWSRILNLHFKPSKVSSLFRAVGMVILCVIILILIHNGIFDSGFIVFFAYFFFLLFFPYIKGYSALLVSKRNKALFEPFSGLANDAHITFKTLNVAAEFKWDLYQKVKQSKDLLLLYQNKHSFNYFSRKFFESDASWQAFIDLVHKKVNKK